MYIYKRVIKNYITMSPAMFPPQLPLMYKHFLMPQRRFFSSTNNSALFAAQTHPTLSTSTDYANSITFTKNIDLKI